MGILMSLGYYPQAWKMFKSKSAKGISVITFLIFGVGNIVWLWYGIALKDFVIILSFVIGVAGAWLVLALYMLYRNNSHDEQLTR